MPLGTVACTLEMFAVVAAVNPYVYLTFADPAMVELADQDVPVSAAAWTGDALTATSTTASTIVSHARRPARLVPTGRGIQEQT